MRSISCHTSQFECCVRETEREREINRERERNREGKTASQQRPFNPPLWCVKLTTYHHPVPLSRNLGALTSWNPLGLSRSVMGLLYLYLLPPPPLYSKTCGPKHSETSGRRRKKQARQRRLQRKIRLR